MILRPKQDDTNQIVRENLSRIGLLAVAGTIFLDDRQVFRLTSILMNYDRFGIPRPFVIVGAHSNKERAAAEDTLRGLGIESQQIRIIDQVKHNELVGNALTIFAELLDSNAERFAAKRHILVLARRGGQGEPTFIEPFTGGAGTTCAAWTKPVFRKPNGEVIKGFLKAALTVGFCPVECPFCYLQMAYTDGMTINMNWEELADELNREWAGHPYPINFSETSGIVEYDEWFAGPDGEGSMVQYVIDACARAEVTPFLLTKIRFPRYLQFNGRVQVGISAMPESIRQLMAPHGSPTEELVQSLAWAVDAGAFDPVVRLLFLRESRDQYVEMLHLLREHLGTSGWRLTLDILRFTPITLSKIAKRYPELADVFAAELGDGTQTLTELASGSTDKKVRPSIERQAEMYRWIRSELDRIGCQAVAVSACKGNPDELLPLVRNGVIDAMPCACYGVGEPPLVQLQP